MKLSQLFAQKKVVFSLEIFPPKKTSPIESITNTLGELCPLRPDFISVTYGAGGSETAGRSTCDIAELIAGRYGVTPLAHLTCLGATRAQVSQKLDKLEAAGIENILALRGDRVPDAPPCGEFRHATELVRYIRERGGFHVAGACYPEGHIECETLQEDIAHLKEKVEAGAQHLCSQLFFDNEYFYRFIEQARAAGIEVPIEAGIMPVINKRQIERMVSMCGVSIPRPLARILSRYGEDPLAMRDAGIAYAVQQIVDLIAGGVQGIHLYTMNNPYVAQKISEAVRSILYSENLRHE